MIPLPSINSTCAYTFTTEFIALNGIYTLTELTSYSESLLLGTDYIKQLYTPAGVAESQFIVDAANYKNDVVLFLTPANGGTDICVPVSLLTNIPDPMVGCYNKLAIGVSLGLFDDQTRLQWVIDELNTIVSGVIGVSSPVKLYSLGITYMSVDDYNAMEATRDSARSAYNTLYQQLQEQIALTQAAQNLNTYYEQTLIALAGP